MNEKKRTEIVLKLGLTDENALMYRIMKNSNIKKVEFIEEDVLQLTYNDGNTWTIVSEEIEEVQKKHHYIKFE